MTPNKIKLTDSVVARTAAPDGKADFVLWDAEVTGFGLRLQRGRKTYIVSYRPAGAGRSANAKRVKLGTPETIPTATEARRLAKAMVGKVAGGGDPAADRAEDKRRARARVSELLDRYEADLKRRKYVARTMVMNLLRRRLKRHLSKDIATLKGADYAAIIERLENAGLPGAADAFRSRCRAFLTYCHVRAKVIDHNPLIGYRRERPTRADKVARDQHGRALSDEELAKVWNAADPETVFGRYLRALILTGCRRNEAAGLVRSMLCDRRRVLDLPPIFVKQGRGHIVPISPELSAVLEKCTVDPRSDLFFPSPRTGGRMSGWNRLKPPIAKASGVSFTLHDLRRTFRTGLSRLGVSKDVAELAIGHAREVLEEIYNRDGAAEQIRAAFEAWGRHVDRIARLDANRLDNIAA